MQNPNPYIAQDTPVVPQPHANRRRHSRQRVPTKKGPARPGRLFKIRRKLLWLRLDMQPFNLGAADWLLYHHRFNPYRASSHKARAYERGFLACKSIFPKPDRTSL